MTRPFKRWYPNLPQLLRHSNSQVTHLLFILLVLISTNDEDSIEPLPSLKSPFFWCIIFTFLIISYFCGQNTFVCFVFLSRFHNTTWRAIPSHSVCQQFFGQGQNSTKTGISEPKARKQGCEAAKIFECLYRSGARWLPPRAPHSLHFCARVTIS